ncbi:hypothetical protein H1S01_03445 [Heliobacterium chlorum]|uniref:YolD-like protein n=1 Tax=Heliobacterium chlorum TaxID=2698 RepID=A0ABR7T057_HELCL|nr:hypothetical protein [Heliobacterium chlorum]MBC9783567.1 hypothetical protein [Heliobacterium chlorum]
MSFYHTGPQKMSPRAAEFFRKNMLWRSSFFLPEHREGTIAGRHASLAEQLTAPSEVKKEEMEYILSSAMRNRREVRIRLQDGKWLSAIPVTAAGGVLFVVDMGVDREVRLNEIIDVVE